MAKQSKKSQPRGDEVAVESTQLLTSKEAAARLEITEDALRRVVRKAKGGKLPRGARYAFREADLAKLKALVGELGAGGTRVVFDLDAVAK